MKTEIEAAIKELVKISTETTKGVEAMQFTQAALNLMHVHAAFAAYEHFERQKTPSLVDLIHETSEATVGGSRLAPATYDGKTGDWA